MNHDHSCDKILRAAALGAILLAGSCAVQNDGTTAITEDGAVNHPIAVEPSFRDLKLQFAGGADGMTADDAVKFDDFLADYRAHGNGSLGISVPNGAPSPRRHHLFRRARRRKPASARQDPGLHP